MTKAPTFGRVVFLQFCFFCAFTLIVLKLFSIQVLNHKNFQAKAMSQHQSVVDLKAKRGDILTADGYRLATSSIVFLLYGEPKRIKDPSDVSEKLAPILVTADGLSAQDYKIALTDKEQFLEESLKKNLFWVVLSRRITSEQKEEIEKLQLKGIGFEDQSERYYPEGSLGSHVLGYIAGSESGEEKGYFGIEGYFDGDLKGQAGRIVEEKSASGKSIIIGGYNKIPTQNGRSIKLTLNRQIQFLVENKLKEGVEKYKAKSGSVVIMNPENGDVLAMANYPTYFPDKTFEEPKESTTAARKEIKNLAITDVYEPGSIIKPLTVAAAVDLGMIDAKTTYEDNGPVYYSGHRVDNWDSKHHGTMTIRQLLEKSNNIGASWVGTKLGATKLYEYFKKFGLGETTQIQLEGENPGILRNPEGWRDIDVATASFGQGISTSIIQVAQAFSVFANGGVLIQPRIIEAIIDGDRVIEYPVKQKRRVLSRETVEQMKDMLSSAVASGESKFFNLEGYTIAGKTGTAQIFINDAYDPNKTNTTFVGFLPNAPSGKKFIMVVKLSEPETSIFAAETAVPLWMGMLKELVPVLKISPDK